MAITQADITDERADDSVCGFVASQFKELDFSQFACLAHGKRQDGGIVYGVKIDIGVPFAASAVHPYFHPAPCRDLQMADVVPTFGDALPTAIKWGD